MDLKVGDVFTIPWRLTINATPGEMRAYDCGREEGRREVLREIADLDPHSLEFSNGGSTWTCKFCDLGYTTFVPLNHELEAFLDTHHEKDCLWLRAVQAVKDAE